jgi:cytochrome c-type biogenesis protein
VIDLAGDALRAVAGGSGWAYPLLFLNGTLTSIGPCIAPRYVAVAALAGSSRRPLAVLSLFGLGVVGAYVALGAAAGALGALIAWSAPLYATLATILIVAGIVTLVRATPHAHAEGTAARVPASAGGTLLLGAATTLVVSPCCTPVIAAIAGLTIVSGRPATGAALLIAFALGHAAPLLLAAAGARAPFAQRLGASPVPSIVGATLLIALGGFYGALA